MKAPRNIRTYCPKCEKHTEHSVSLYRKGRDRTLAEGNRRYARKKKGYGGQPGPIQRKTAKTTRRLALQLTCRDCGYVSQRPGTRLRKLEITA